MSLTVAARVKKALPSSGLEFNSIALMISTAVTGALGLVFWVITAWGYPAAEVGRAAAIISSATMLAAFANLSLGHMYERFLAVGGKRARQFIRAGYGISSGLALLFGTAFVIVGPSARLFPTTTEAVLFPLYVVVVAVFALQDPVLVGIHAARWVAVKNIAHSLAKLALVAMFAWLLGSGVGVVWAWMIPTLGVALAIQFVLSGRWLAPFDSIEPVLPPLGQLWSYFAISYAMTVVGGITPFIVPLIVVDQLGTEANAYFNGAWTLVAALALMLHVIAGPFVAQASSAPDRLPELAARLARLQAVASIGGALGLATIGPVFLQVMGPDYAAEATDLLRWIALSLPLLALNAFYVALCRVYRRLRMAATTQCAAALLIVTGSMMLVGDWGITAIGWSYLTAEIIVSLIIAGPLIRMIRQLRPGNTPTEVP